MQVQVQHQVQAQVIRVSDLKAIPSHHHTVLYSSHGPVLRIWINPYDSTTTFSRTVFHLSLSNASNLQIFFRRL